MKTRLVIALATVAIVAAIIWHKNTPQKIQVELMPAVETPEQLGIKERNFYIMASNAYAKSDYEKEFETPNKTTWTAGELNLDSEYFETPFIYGEALKHKTLGEMTKETVEEYLKRNP